MKRFLVLLFVPAIIMGQSRTSGYRGEGGWLKWQVLTAIGDSCKWTALGDTIYPQDAKKVKLGGLYNTGTTKLDGQLILNSTVTDVVDIIGKLTVTDSARVEKTSRLKGEVTYGAAATTGTLATNGKITSPDTIVSVKGVRTEGPSLLKGPVTANTKAVIMDSLRVEETSLLKGTVTTGADIAVTTKAVVNDSLRIEETALIKGALTANTKAVINDSIRVEETALFKGNTSLKSGVSFTVGAVQWDVVASDSINGAQIAARTIPALAIPADVMQNDEMDASSELAAIMDDETGTAGNLVFSTSPTLTGVVDADTVKLDKIKFEGGIGIVRTGALGFMVQDADMPTGIAGGGLHLVGNGYDSDADKGGVFAGMTSDLGTYTARSTTASGIVFSNGRIVLEANSGLVVGNTFTPTNRFILDPSGTLCIGADLTPDAMLEVENLGGSTVGFSVDGNKTSSNLFQVINDNDGNVGDSSTVVNSKGWIGLGINAAAMFHANNANVLSRPLFRLGRDKNATPDSLAGGVTGMGKWFVSTNPADTTGLFNIRGRKTTLNLVDISNDYDGSLGDSLGFSIGPTGLMTTNDLTVTTGQDFKVGAIQWDVAGTDYINGSSIDDADYGDITLSSHVWTVEDDSHDHTTTITGKAANVSDADFGDVTVASGAWAVEDDSHNHTTLSSSLVVGSVSADSMSFNAGILTVNNDGAASNEKIAIFRVTAGEKWTVDAEGDVVQSASIDIGTKAVVNDSLRVEKTAIIKGTLQTGSVTMTNILTSCDSLTVQREASNIADDGTIVLATGIAGWGSVMAGDAEQWADFYFKADGTVTLKTNSAKVTNFAASGDDSLMVYDAGSGVAIKNRLGATKKVAININYFTP